MGNKNLEVRYLFLKDLASLPIRISALGLLPLLPSGVGPPFHPDQKVKIDKTLAARAVLFFRHDSLGYDGDGHTFGLLTGQIHFRAGWDGMSVRAVTARR